MILSSTLSPAHNTDLRQIVYEKLKEAILDGIIPPGERLSEVELAEQLMVSRTPVREAIRQLAETGLIMLIPRRGAFVILPTTEDARHLYEVRSALELFSLERLCQNPPREKLENLREAFVKVSDASDSKKFLELDMELHHLIRKGSGNPFLESVLHNVMDLIHLCRRYALYGASMERSAEEHIRIIDAILKKDVRGAQEALTQHLFNAMNTLTEYLAKHPEYTRKSE
jgi:DNA-binding GntR family transcriptional regulator